MQELGIERAYKEDEPQVGERRREGFRHRALQHNREFSMLVLSRKLGEKIVIGDNIVVTVVKIDRNQIRIGIEALQEVPVYREEISPARTGNIKLTANEAALTR